VAERSIGIRETLNRHPKVVLSVIGVIVLATVGFTVQAQRPPGLNPPKYAYFSDDDGKTFFKDSATRVPPFDRGGKQAVAAYVFKGADGKLFVAYLERAISAAAREKIQHARAEIQKRAAQQAVPMPDSDLMELISRNLEVKRPGDKAWVAQRDPRAGEVMFVSGADGNPAEPVGP
jgi:hypothetical protein